MARFRSKRMGIGRRLIGWIAAYALVLHAVLAGVVVTQSAAVNSAAHGFEICLTDPDGAPIPAGKHAQHESCAIHCSAVANGTPPAAALVVATAFFPSFTVTHVTYATPAGTFDLPHRDGLGSRAPPAA